MRLIDPRAMVSYHVLPGALQVQMQIEAILTIGYETRVSDDWYDRLDAALNNVRNSLRNRRNRLVHDNWTMINGTEAIRYEERATVRYAQAGQLAFSPARTEIVSAADIILVAHEVLAANQSVFRLLAEFLDHQKQSSPDKG